MKKEYTEQERRNLAADVSFAARVLFLIGSTDGGRTEFDWEYYEDRLEEAVEYLSPGYAEDY